MGVENLDGSGDHGMGGGSVAAAGGDRIDRAPKKPLVHYRQLIFCKLGLSALVCPVDHPSELVSNRKPIMTSPVTVEVDGDGGFETLNTRYQPAPKPRV